MLLPFLAFSAFAHDIEIRVDVPGGAPVWTTLADARPGSSQTIAFQADKRTTYRLVATVEEAKEGYDWRVTFDLSSARRGKPFTRVMQPTMSAHSEETARVTMGAQVPVEGSPAVTFHGYEIEWTARESGA